MRFASVTLQHFRNLPLAQVAFRGQRTFLLGANAQGKTNFLEALGYVTALRSFRGAEPRALVALNQREAGAGFVLEHETFGETRLTLRLGPDGRTVDWEQGRVTRLADFIGRFPTVAFSSQDNQLLRGAPGLRRRWLDLTLASAVPGYLVALQGYTRAIAERNMLLKHGGRDAASLSAFEQTAAEHAAILTAARARGLAELGAHFAEAHARIAVEGGGAAALLYAPDREGGVAEFAQGWAASRPRDLILKSTERGPHRDEVELLLDERPARQFASEGQQRGLVLALRLAQAAYYQAKSGVQPVLLCDDVLGELDPARRRRFWAALAGEPQVVATGTSAPEDGGDWQVWQVANGQITGEGANV